MSRTIIFAMLQESGHLNPTFRIARGLRDRGLQVAYFALPELVAGIEKQGFHTLPWFPELFPEGSVAHEAEQPTLVRRRAITARYLAMAKLLLGGGGPLASLSQLGPVFCLVDVTQPLMAFALRRAGIPFAYIHTSLPQTKDGSVPPLRSSLRYDPSPDGTRVSERAWERFLLKRSVSAALAAPLGMAPTYALAESLAERFGIARGELDCATSYMPQLRGVAELVLCPAAFDYPRPARHARHHVESLDLGRREVDFDFARIPRDKPLVYASLGSQLYGRSDGRAFLTRLTQAFAGRPDLTLLVSLGRHMQADELPPCPPNVIAVQSAPQLAILRRARLMVTHGGLGSIKECLYHGVPMLVCPLDVDQPGNAARVEHHGVGITMNIAEESEARLLWVLDCLLLERSYTTLTAEMQRRFAELEGQNQGAALVAGWAGQTLVQVGGQVGGQASSQPANQTDAPNGRKVRRIHARA